MPYLLLAQASESIWPSVIQALSNNGFWVFIGTCVLAGTAKHIVGMVLRHRERMAMIDAGLTPGTDDSADPQATIHYKNHG